MSARYAEGRSARAPVTVKPFQIRGRFLTALALRPESGEADAAFYDALDEQLRQTPQFFADAPMILDFSRLGEPPDEAGLRKLVRNLRQRHLRVFGIQSAAAAYGDVLQSLGLIPISTARDAPAPGGDEDRRAQRADRLLPPDNKLVSAPVRSGQVVMAERGDLTVVGSVASGAELIASGNIHVYGTLRGRALAGIQGDEGARIFCQKLDAELVAIAGFYQTSETLLDVARDRCTQIFLENERLRMETFA